MISGIFFTIFTFGFGIICTWPLILIGFILFIVGLVVPSNNTTVIQQTPACPPYPPYQSQQLQSSRHCPNCGRSIPNDSIICPFCGKDFISKDKKPETEKMKNDSGKKKLTEFCTECGNKFDGKEKYCSKCGAKRR